MRRYETGGTTREEFADEIIGEFGLPVDAATFLRAFAHWPRALFPGATALLAELAPRYRLASVSNTNELHWERFHRDWSLDAHFHHNFPSHEVGKLKPDAEYFAARDRRARRAGGSACCSSTTTRSTSRPRPARHRRAAGRRRRRRARALAALGPPFPDRAPIPTHSPAAVAIATPPRERR